MSSKTARTIQPEALLHSHFAPFWGKDPMVRPGFAAYIFRTVLMSKLSPFSRTAKQLRDSLSAALINVVYPVPEPTPRVGTPSIPSQCSAKAKSMCPCENGTDEDAR